MSTLRRELRIKFKEILAIYFDDYDDSHLDKVADILADEVVEVQKPAFDMSKAGIEWNILAGAEIKQHDIDETVLLKNTIDAFESAFSIKGNWNWYPAKPQEMRVWENFREFLVKLYRVDKDCFTKYVTWIAQPYSRGTMTGRQIKNNPQDFPDAWASFCMSTKYQPPRQSVPDGERTDLDESGAPISYM